MTITDPLDAVMVCHLAVQRAVREMRAAEQQYGLGSIEARRASNQLRGCYVDHAEANAACCASLANRRGWIVASRAFGLANLLRASHYPADYEPRWPLLDHVECFREPARPYRPVAILTHSYDTRIDEHLSFAAEHGLRAEVLPLSWYYPGGTLAVLYTRL